jgi:hypothetical protein
MSFLPLCFVEADDDARRSRPPTLRPAEHGDGDDVMDGDDGAAMPPLMPAVRDAPRASAQQSATTPEDKGEQKHFFTLSPPLSLLKWPSRDAISNTHN